VGDWFPKIGIGLLKKMEGEYSFQQAYEIKPCKFDNQLQSDRVIIICTSPAHNGYAYRLTKEISLTENGFVIRYQLDNTGEKAIITDEYNHNFLSIGQQLLSKDDVLRFSFPMNTDQFDAHVDPEQLIQWHSHGFSFQKTPSEPIFFSNVSGGKAVEARWELFNQKEGLGLREIGNFPTQKINIWGCEHVISPELFFAISLRPGQSIEWSRRYEYFTKE